MSDDFEEFWRQYPNRGRRVAKAACKAKWDKMGLEMTGKEIVDHVKAMCKSEQWQKGFEPMPMTYLNQGRWMDGLPDECKPRPVRDTFMPESFVAVDPATRARIAEKLKTVGKAVKAMPA